ncbi:MAG: acetyl-CoA carboxylase, carboxyltransferase subunit beta [Gammaproteobacteria bacterium]|nr:acetyl-CoA carboxylase, carboxyltransferase subunit beta [Gammaproteobacteria bacterium]
MNWYTTSETPGVKTQPLAEWSLKQWTLCPKCQTPALKSQWASALNVCGSCQYHAPLSAQSRLAMLCDQIIHPIRSDLQPKDFLKFFDTQPYSERLKIAAAKNKSSEAIEVVYASIAQVPLVCAAFDFGFIGGSMGAVVGERFVQGVQFACQNNLPFLCVATSGGARMQEGVLSLMQMARTSAALAQFSQKRLPYLVVLASPCMGGVSASLASLGDLTIAEPGALIGFTGPKVIEQTVGKKLPKDFQTSESLKQQGFCDAIVHRHDLKQYLARFLHRWA